MNTLMKITFCIFLTFVFTFHAIAGDKKTDSLLQIVSGTKDASEKAKTFNLIAEEYQGSNPKLMRTYALKALHLNITDPVIEGKTNQNIGIANLILGEYTEALKYFTNAKNIFEKALGKPKPTAKKELQNGLARAYGCMGIVFSEQSNISKALIYYLKAIKINREINNLDNTARLYNNVGIVYLNHGKKREALNYLLKCLKLQVKLKDPTIGITLTNIGNISRQLGKNDDAIYYFKKALLAFDHYPDPRGLGELYNQ